MRTTGIMLDAKIGGMARWTVHDLRRSFVTNCSELGIAEPHIIERPRGIVCQGIAAGFVGDVDEIRYRHAADVESSG